MKETTTNVCMVEAAGLYEVTKTAPAVPLQSIPSAEILLRSKG